MNRKFRRVGGVRGEVYGLERRHGCPYYGRLSLIFGTSLRDVGVLYEQRRAVLGLRYTLGTGGFRSKKVNFLGTYVVEGCFI